MDLHPEFPTFASELNPLDRLASAISLLPNRDQQLRNLKCCIEALLLVREAFRRAGAKEEELQCVLRQLKIEAERIAFQLGVARLPLPELTPNGRATVPVPDLDCHLHHFTALRDYWASGEHPNEDADTIRWTFKKRIRSLGQRRSRLAKLRSHVSVCSEIIERAAAPLERQGPKPN